MQNKQILSTILLASALAGSALAQNLVTNSKFAGPSNSSGTNAGNGSTGPSGFFGSGQWGLFSTISGWSVDTTLDPSSYLEIGNQDTYDTTGFTGNVLELNSDQQSAVYTTTISSNAGDEMDLRFLYAMRGTQDGSGRDTNTFKVLWDGSSITGADFDPKSTKAQLFDISVLSTGTDTLTFVSTTPPPGSSYGGIIGDVSVVDKTGNPNFSSAPSPASYLSFGLGFGTLGLLRFRRRN